MNAMNIILGGTIPFHATQTVDVTCTLLNQHVHQIWCSIQVLVMPGVRYDIPIKYVTLNLRLPNRYDTK